MMSTGFWMIFTLGLLVGLVVGGVTGWVARGKRRRWVA